VVRCVRCRRRRDDPIGMVPQGQLLEPRLDGFVRHVGRRRGEAQGGEGTRRRRGGPAREAGGSVPSSSAGDALDGGAGRREWWKGTAIAADAGNACASKRMWPYAHQSPAGGAGSGRRGSGGAGGETGEVPGAAAHRGSLKREALWTAHASGCHCPHSSDILPRFRFQVLVLSGISSGTARLK
jgi:hypothetical protein